MKDVENQELIEPVKPYHNYEPLTREVTDWGLLFDVRCSMMYNSRRYSFYQNLDLFMLFIIFTFLCYMLYDLQFGGPFKAYNLLILCGLCVAGFYSVSMKNLHYTLKNEFADLEIDIKLKKSADFGQLRTRLLIEKQEPPIHMALYLLCRNNLLISFGYTKQENPEYFANISKFQKLTCQIFEWPDISQDIKI